MSDKFPEFPKISRFLEQDVVITEKIDGTNGLICIEEVCDGAGYPTLTIRAGSRTRWITPEDDNFGFARWVQENREELLKLGVGHHYGEWWGQGIQRNYGMKQKVFSLFNSTRWADPDVRPTCCDVVPVLYEGPLRPLTFQALYEYQKFQSVAAKKYRITFDNPEGVMIFFTKAREYFKHPFELGSKG